MARADLVVDYLVIGIGGVVWAAPALLALFGRDWLYSLVDPGATWVVLALLAVYLAGICVSQLAAAITRPVFVRIRKEVFGTGSGRSYFREVTFIAGKSQAGSEYLRERRSMANILRGCAVDFGAGSVAWLAAGYLRAGGVPLPTAVTVAVICAVLCALMVLAYVGSLRAYFRGVKEMYGALKG